MEFENNWRSKTLENLEKITWEKPEFDSHLVITCHQLRKKQLNKFSNEDLRIMIRQNIGLPFLIPMVIELLEKDILAEGDCFEGDLLLVVLSSDSDYWKKEPENWKKICELFEENEEYIETFDTSRSIKRDWVQSLESFSKINA